jgi:DNA modification methylase
MPNENQIYLDPFIGSGTTAIACTKLGKKWIGIEVNPEYVEIAKRRIQKTAGQYHLF